MEIKRGSTRTVILTTRYAIKIPSGCEWRLFLRGLLANMQEVRWSVTAVYPPDHPGRTRLAQVLWSIPGGWLLVMERAYVPPNFHRKFFAKGLIDWQRMFDGLPLDPNETNFGFIGRRLVLVDYGS